MERISIAPRPDLDAKAREAGFDFANIDGEIYWDERAYYAFSLRQIEEDLEGPSNDLSDLCLDLVGRAVRDERILQRLAIPRHAWDLIADSWNRGDRSLYGRFDLAYDGHGSAKLLEYNADTPTALFEAAVFQWGWLEDSIARNAIPANADQFNSIHEALVAEFKLLASRVMRPTLHLACVATSAEDRGLISYLAECAKAAGFHTIELDIAQIGTTGAGPFVDLDGNSIHSAFKLYPWEWMFRDAFIRSASMQHTRFLEPPWKAILSNKGILPLLWAMAPNHPNLLPAYFEDDGAASRLGPSYVRKPLHSREGSNVSLVVGREVVESTDGPYDREGAVLQAIASMPAFEGNTPVVGSWIVAGKACGIGIREDTSLITQNSSRFVPHAIVDA